MVRLEPRPPAQLPAAGKTRSRLLDELEEEARVGATRGNRLRRFLRQLAPGVLAHGLEHPVPRPAPAPLTSPTGSSWTRLLSTSDDTVSTAPGPPATPPATPPPGPPATPPPGPPPPISSPAADTTASAAPRSNPPANTDNRRSARRSGSSSRSYDQSTSDRSARCRAGAVRGPDVSRPSRSSRRRSMSATDMVRTLAAASSTASGIPSSRAQIDATAGPDDASSAKPAPLAGGPLHEQAHRLELPERPRIRGGVRRRRRRHGRHLVHGLARDPERRAAGGDHPQLRARPRSAGARARSPRRARARSCPAPAGAAVPQPLDRPALLIGAHRSEDPTAAASSAGACAPSATADRSHIHTPS